MQPKKRKEKGGKRTFEQGKKKKDIFTAYAGGKTGKTLHQRNKRGGGFPAKPHRLFPIFRRGNRSAATNQKKKKKKKETCVQPVGSQGKKKKNLPYPREGQPRSCPRQKKKGGGHKGGGEITFRRCSQKRSKKRSREVINKYWEKSREPIPKGKGKRLAATKKQNPSLCEGRTESRRMIKLRKKRGEKKKQANSVLHGGMNKKTQEGSLNFQKARKGKKGRLR